MGIFRIVVSVMVLMGAISAQAASFKEAYAKKAYQDYVDATEAAEKVNQAVQNFLNETTAANLELLKREWIAARTIYSPTEIYRFYGGPIDAEDGPEGLINAWPLDEAYIDYVKGNSNSGIINNVEQYPEITKELLTELNEKDGEKNISTGWHALEFLIWGQDFNLDGPGDRPLSDYIVGEGKNAERRRAYLAAASELLVEHIASVAQAWDPTKSDSYYQTFTQLEEKAALTNAFTSLVSMAASELAIERMFVAIDVQAQEDEHSCFSDTTHLDIKYNYLGILETWSVVKHTSGLMEQNPQLVADIDTKMTALTDAVTAFQGPFDVAIFEEEGRQELLAIVDQLQVVGEDFKKAAHELGIVLP